MREFARGTSAILVVEVHEHLAYELSALEAKPVEQRTLKVPAVLYALRILKGGDKNMCRTHVTSRRRLVAHDAVTGKHIVLPPALRPWAAPARVEDCKTAGSGGSTSRRVESRARYSTRRRWCRCAR